MFKKKSAKHFSHEKNYTQFLHFIYLLSNTAIIADNTKGLSSVLESKLLKSRCQVGLYIQEIYEKDCEAKWRTPG